MGANQAISGFQLMGTGPGFKQEICEMIAETQLFSDLSWPEIESLAAFVQCYEVPAGICIFSEGEPGNYLCLLITGQIAIEKEDQDGVSKQLVVITRGKTVGEMSIIDGEPRSATCTALSDSVVLLLTKENYQRLIKERPGLAITILSRVAKLMSQRLRALSGQLVEHLEDVDDDSGVP
jgi:CRP/FNR family cyclic AMP-dependent transcriptional regulator